MVATFAFFCFNAGAMLTTGQKRCGRNTVTTASEVPVRDRLEGTSSGLGNPGRGILEQKDSGPGPRHLSGPLLPDDKTLSRRRPRRSGEVSVLSWEKN